MVTLFLNRCKTLKEQLKKQTPTNYCRICFKKISKYSIEYLFNQKQYVCSKCLNEMNPKIKKIQIGTIRGYGIYPYNKKIQELIFQYKGCYDIELANVFFARYKFLINLLFKNWVVVPVPSYQGANKERGFNHVEELVKTLKIKMIPCLIKKENIKQSSLNRSQRMNIKDRFTCTERIKELKNKNVLIIDDVLTTGSTLKACITKIEEICPKKISFIVLSYVISKFVERIL